MKSHKPIAEGNTARIYPHEEGVVKIFKEHFPEGEAAREAEKQEYAFSHGLSVPKIVEVTRIDGKQAIIMEFIEGQTLGDLFLKDSERSVYYLGLSIEVQQKIHTVTGGDIGSMAEKLSRQLDAAPMLNQSQKAALKEKLHEMPFEERLCHGDFHLFNVMMKDQKVTVIDWVDASAGDPRADVCRTYLLYTSFSQELADLYLRLYCEKTGTEEEEILTWTPIIAGARLAEHVPSEDPDRLLNMVKAYCSL
ncbi:phosphotransferase family protein [Jeotgalibacillus proteolyticus]|uniref:Aminoglycoside phosphotransferase n=1 Tax=Jeotgalibacillus proteolyticus TaxID=2082395 RepID=A0A2S5GD86_9BACL|nr:aminoglycoside phosphotransferase family protein [Jeotgalibacillus proteolyticus]PPA71002.1 aminoglycoside phosphotransferase [Jeotgalibacillus proteolyticus]